MQKLSFSKSYYGELLQKFALRNDTISFVKTLIEKYETLKQEQEQAHEFDPLVITIDSQTDMVSGNGDNAPRTPVRAVNTSMLSGVLSSPSKSPFSLNSNTPSIPDSPSRYNLPKSPLNRSNCVSRSPLRGKMTNSFPKSPLNVNNFNISSPKLNKENFALLSFTPKEQQRQRTHHFVPLSFDLDSDDENNDLRIESKETIDANGVSSMKKLTSLLPLGDDYEESVKKEKESAKDNSLISKKLKVTDETRIDPSFPSLFPNSELKKVYQTTFRANIKTLLNKKLLAFEEAAISLSKWSKLPIYASNLVVKRSRFYGILLTKGVSEINQFQMEMEMEIDDINELDQEWDDDSELVSSKAFVLYCLKRLCLDECDDVHHALFRVLLDTYIESTAVDFESLENAGADLNVTIPKLEKLPEPSKDANSTTLRMFNLREIIGIVIEHHPSFEILREDKSFCPYYIDTVALRLCRDGSVVGHTLPLGFLRLAQFRHCGLYEALSFFERNDDISDRRDAFCYEHFYVLYCKFWELDTDHNLLLTMKDILSYSQSQVPTLTNQIARYVSQYHQVPIKIQRELATGKVLPEKILSENRFSSMSFIDFVCFVLSEEDRKHPMSIRYWFNVIDVDQDGILSECEIMNFYQAVQTQLVNITSESIPFGPFLSEILDMIGLQQTECQSRVEVTLSHLLKNETTGAWFFDALVGAKGFFHYDNREKDSKTEKIEELTRRGGITVDPNGIITLDPLNATPDFESADEKRWCNRTWDKFATKIYNETVEGEISENESEYESEFEEENENEEMEMEMEDSVARYEIII